MDGKPLPASAITISASGQQAVVAVGEVAHPVTFDFTLTAGGATR
jgi:hypothetical protein